MALSYAEQTALTCPSCGERFGAEVWTLVDAAERPDLVDLLREDRLNLMTCPRCGHSAPADAPLLLHDGVARRVYFAAPADAAEHEVREQAQALLYVLVGSLPEEARLPYLGDVQVNQELSGMRRSLLRDERRRGAARAPAAPPPSPAAPPAAPPPAPVAPAAPAPAPLLDVVRDLLGADSAEDFEAAVAREPALLDPSTDALLDGLIDAAAAQGEREVAHALREVRQILRDMRGGSAADPAPEPQPAAARPALPDAAFSALMQAQSQTQLADVVRDHPALLESWADDEIGARVEAALDDANERLASAIEERREALDELRREIAGEAAIAGAIQALIRAGDEEDALTHAISAHPVLLTDAAQDALFRLAAEARARGDDPLAERAVEYRDMLRTVRDGLEEGP